MSWEETSVHIGERVAAHRKRRGLSQDALAGLIGRSRSWLSQVERGLRDVDKLSTVHDLATVLQVRPAYLIGDVWDATPADAHRQRAVEQIRSRLAAYPSLTGEPRALWPLPQLRNATAEVHRAYQSAKYDGAAAMVPDLLEAVDAYSRLAGTAAEQIQLARCSAYAVAAKLLTKLGESHAAWLAADRAAQAALVSESSTAQGIAAYQVACALLRNDQIHDAEHVAVAAAERLTAIATPGTPEVVSVAGANWLLAAIIAARRIDRAETRTRLAAARSLAERLDRDGNHAWTAFGPTNVDIHAASAAAELGDPRAVLDAATRVDVDRLPPGLTGRRAQVHVDLAWAQAQARNDAEAILHLQRVERLASEIVRHHTVARRTTRELLKRTRRPSPALTVLATRTGILA